MCVWSKVINAHIIKATLRSQNVCNVIDLQKDCCRGKRNEESAAPTIPYTEHSIHNFIESMFNNTVKQLLMQ